MPEQRFLIAGGGIGELVAALGLAKKGRRALVLEKAAQLGNIGAGIQFGPNAFHAFDDLGIGDAARAMAVYVDNLRLMDTITGEEITRVPLDDPFRFGMGNPQAAVHHGDLRRNAITLRAGPKCQIVHYPLRGWRRLNLVFTCHNDAPDPVASKPVTTRPAREAVRTCRPDGAADHRHAGRPEALGAGRPRPGDDLDRWSRGPVGRCRTSHAAIFRPRRMLGDGRCRLPVGDDRRGDRVSRDIACLSGQTTLAHGTR